VDVYGLNSFQQTTHFFSLFLNITKPHTI